MAGPQGWSIASLQLAAGRAVPGHRARVGRQYARGNGDMRVRAAEVVVGHASPQYHYLIGSCDCSAPAAHLFLQARRCTPSGARCAPRQWASTYEASSVPFAAVLLALLGRGEGRL